MALFIGFTLGFFGGGGSILTLPVFVYVCGISPVLATAYSLFVVGVSASFGALDYAKKKLIDFRVGIFFAIPSIVAVYLTRVMIMPALPDVWFSIFGLSVKKDNGILILFAIIMVTAAFFMMYKRTEKNRKGMSKKVISIPLILVEGSVIGVITGIVGAGGGFLIVPSLVIISGLSIKRAIGTTLMIISLKSLFGFLGDLQVQMAIDWVFLLKFTSLSIIGIFIGSNIGSRAKPENLKIGFAWFILIMGLIMFIKEIFLTEI